ncbi:M48 family metalloprotease [Candidatus Protochlamydia amoebophila]|uniref:Peptidase M48 domain-containing protein n=1 Tax=Protochlamydia amoebophila (strain UWE25) TaxID=264201 RepID=Q6MF62_PARUW|nr:M48 family metalloprotease [Candidatus Protochlamydia amoebophila]CAF22787.1 unnamed protein product [Candidatus Protochlamydia amoebophila UWE25]
MFVLPFLSSPCGYSLQAYKSTCIEIPIIVIDGLFNQKRVYRGSQEYNQQIKSFPGYNIKTELQPFFDRIGIRQDIIVIERLNLGFCGAQGTNFFTKGDAVIWVAPKFHKVDKGACHWVMKHEACHIKNNDCFTMPLIPAICSIAAATFSAFMMPIIPALLITMSVGFIAQAIFSQYREGKADDLAITESSVEELKGGRRLLMSLQQTNLESRTTIWKKLVISSSGENRFDFLHPSTASRLKKIERALQQKDVQIDEGEEVEKIVKLKNLMVEINLKIEKELKELGTFGLMKAMQQ